MPPVPWNARLLHARQPVFCGVQVFGPPTPRSFWRRPRCCDYCGARGWNSAKDDLLLIFLLDGSLRHFADWEWKTRTVGEVKRFAYPFSLHPEPDSAIAWTIAALEWKRRLTKPQERRGEFLREPWRLSPPVEPEGLCRWQPAPRPWPFRSRALRTDAAGAKESPCAPKRSRRFSRIAPGDCSASKPRKMVDLDHALGRNERKIP